MRRAFTYLGVFLVAQATLMLEILLTRITSVTAWYHLAFFIISLAMLGMTAGAARVFLAPTHFAAELVPRRMAGAALGFALSAPLSVAFTLSIPLAPVTDLASFSSLLAVGAALAAPFTLAGIALTLALTRAGLPPGIAYGVDLVGAAAGCLLVIPLLDRVDAPSAALGVAGLAAVGAFSFAWAAGSRLRAVPAAMAAIGLVALCVANSWAAPPPLRPAWIKGERDQPALHQYVGWNTYSRVAVDHTTTTQPFLWAAGRNVPAEMLRPIEQRAITIDGAAGTHMDRYDGTPGEHAYLAWDVTGFAHQLRPDGAAAIVGVGGGRDVLDAIAAGHRPVVGIELNDLIVDLHRNRMIGFSGIAALDGVELVCDEARSHLASDARRYTTITMSLIDTWASTGAGAYSLSENSLYTTDAWNTFLDRLEPRGVLTVSRWYVMQSPGETARMLALAMETLWSRGVESPRDHLLMVQSGLVATLLVSPSPFSPSDVDRAQEVAALRGFNMLLTPRRDPSHPLLLELARQPSRDAMWTWARSQRLDLTPPTDERPFFFSMLRPSDWFLDRASIDEMDLPFLGNLAATQTLLYATLASLLLTLLTVVAPMWARRGDLRALPPADLAAALGYFAAIGLGFMLVEMALLSRLSVFLGHPTLALAVLLGGIIFFSGLGSLASERIPVDAPTVARLYPLVPALLVSGSGLVLDTVLGATRAESEPVRIVVALAAIGVPALGLGICFPLGLRLVERMERSHGHATALGPWLWGINGACGVCASGLALASSMVWGITTTLVLGTACYFALLAATWRLSKAVLR